MRRPTRCKSARPRLMPAFALSLTIVLTAGCAGLSTTPTCDGSAYRSLNPAHYQPTTGSTHADVPFLAPDV